MRNRQVGVLGVIVFLIFCFYSISRTSPVGLRPLPKQESKAQGAANNQPDPSEIIAFTSKKFASTKPKPAPGGGHPIVHLVTDAEREFEEVKGRQSRTLRDAVAEYRRRYGLPPPPHFDKWWEFAKSKNVLLVDEFDTIHELLTPFWGLKPATIRARVREALGFGLDNQLMGVQVRNGTATHIFGGFEWLQTALIDMMGSFVGFLPDMDLAFNVNDEPRVVVPHDDMVRLMRIAQTVAMPTVNAKRALRNGFTEKHADLNYDGRFDEVKQTRFNLFAHQAVWTHSRMSCPPDSPARILEEDDQYDDIEKYALSNLGFVYNWTAMSDICLSPSLSSTYGFFERPNAYGVVHDLVPIFSQSKISSYADIIYPSPWYWADKVPYSEDVDPAWDSKLDRLYWRGSTTGGFSRNGGWRRQHRQRFVQKINAPDQAKILTPSPNPPSTADTNNNWTTLEVPRGNFKSLIDVHFSHIGQCDQGDCDAQRAFFSVAEYAKQEDAFQYKHVLDMDGNAFSGRFYALLRSRSLVYKWAIFREWHYEWLRPWVHFVPLSLHGEEWLEVVRVFGWGGGNGNGSNGGSGGGGEGGQEEGGKRKKKKVAARGETHGDGANANAGSRGNANHNDDWGRKEAERLAVQGREWAGKVLRNEDLEAWFFRLLLEYARVIDDDRENIGYSG
ncbi:glycosyltransferase [Achaetomium macrosporum]|uniref:Glycosyltransferase n=1 Tax=Achaetomium macrosporum TaxID=79813 RepID=A0AAN7H9Q4_9PEZI|nr:glycosyltransferase [Achaetomium macrosporum]